MFSPFSTAKLSSILFLQVLCRRPPDECCSNHKEIERNVRGLVTTTQSLAMAQAMAIMGGDIDHKVSSNQKSLTLPTRLLDLDKKHQQQPPPLEATFIYPLNGRPAMSTPRIPPQTSTTADAEATAAAEDMREKYWGEAAQCCGI